MTDVRFCKVQKNPRATDFPQSTAIPAGPAQSGAAARVVRSLDDLDQLAAAWDALAGGAGSPMQQFIWARACAESYCRRGDQLHVVTVGPAGRPTAIAPLIRRRGLGRLEMLGGRELYEPTDFLYADRPALDALAGTLASLGRPICLHRVPADSPTIAALQESYRRRGWVLCRTVSGCPSIPIDASWQEGPERKVDGEARTPFDAGFGSPRATAPVSFELLSSVAGRGGAVARRGLPRGGSGLEGRTRYRARFRTRRRVRSSGDTPPPPPGRASSGWASCAWAVGRSPCNWPSSVANDAG